MNKSDSEAIVVHRKTSASTTLNRKYVKRPTVQPISDMKNPNDIKVQINNHPIEIVARQKLQDRKQQLSNSTTRTLSAQELKEQAIKKALSTVVANSQEKPSPKKLKVKSKISAGRIAFALSCAATLIFVTTYVVTRNISDFSFRVSAMQSGIDATYPKYIPSNYSLDGITSSDGKIIINFKNSTTNSSFKITESKTSWDLATLITNYVKPEFGTNYNVNQKNNITIYSTTSRAVWVHSGILYELNYDVNMLSKIQIALIADSL